MLLYPSLVLNLALVSLQAFLAYHFKEEIIQALLQRKRLKPTIAMLGDSLTEQGDWNTLLSRCDVFRVARAGYTTEQIIKLASTLVVPARPVMCFVMAGLNDIDKRCFSVEATLQNLSQIARILSDNGIKPVFQTVTYSAQNIPLNAQVDQINTKLKELCRAHKYDLIEIGQTLSDGNSLKAEVHTDNIHLNKVGYRIWAEQLQFYLVSHNS